jgi:hypothetical protein
LDDFGVGYIGSQLGVEELKADDIGVRLIGRKRQKTVHSRGEI